MSPPNLQGLNIVQPAQSSDSFLANSNDLLNLSHFPGLSAQLDIWSNLAFESDEPLVRKSDKKSGGEVDESTLSVEDDEEDDADDGQPARADNHDNVVMGDPIIPTPSAQPPVASRAPLNAFDISSLLAGFGIDPYMASSVQSTSATPSLAQILSLYPNAALPPLPPATTESTSQAPAAKRPRPRTRVSSVSPSGEQSSDGASPAADSTMTPLTPAEDKRRRNTAASARFRLKKKEREAALEKKSKELEMRVMELDRECEGLRRENGWLKGLVVGVTGAGTTQQQGPATTGVKRPREEVDGGSN